MTDDTYMRFTMPQDETAHGFLFREQPRIVGRMEVLPGMYYAAYAKPVLLHRAFMWMLLGWKWHDNE